MAGPPHPPRALDPERLRPSGALLRAHIALSAAIQRCAVADTPFDPTTLDLLVRLDLSPSGRLRAVELCRQLSLSPSHVSRMLDRAEEAGLVERGPDPDDRRASLVTITGDGHDAVSDFAPRLDAVVDRVIYQTLDGEEIDNLVDSLDRIEESARTCRVDDH